MLNFIKRHFTKKINTDIILDDFEQKHYLEIKTQINDRRSQGYDKYLYACIKISQEEKEKIVQVYQTLQRYIKKIIKKIIILDKKIEEKDIEIYIKTENDFILYCIYIKWNN